MGKSEKRRCSRRLDGTGRCFEPAVQRVVIGHPPRLVTFYCADHQLTELEAKRDDAEVWPC